MKELLFGLLFLIFGSMLWMCGSGQGAQEGSGIRFPAVAGTFYPAEPRPLKARIEEFFKPVPMRILEGEIRAILVPHAGYVYSGSTAAHAFRLLEGARYDTVLLMGDAHRVSLRGAVIDDSAIYRTPFGDIEVDQELGRRIAGLHESLRLDAAPHKAEHSLEVELPFLQTVLTGSFRIVTLLFGREAAGVDSALVAGLPGLLADRRVLLVLSSDLTHYPTQSTARRIDEETVGVLLSLQRNRFESLIHNYHASRIPNLHCVVCAENTLRCAMDLLPRLGVDHAELLSRSNSGDVAGGDAGRVVGYASIVYSISGGNHGLSATGSEKASDAGQGSGRAESIAEPALTSAQQLFLLTVARTAVESYIREGKIPKIESTDSVLSEKRGAFVTLTKGGDLRGCIGYIEPRYPLLQTVVENAVNAAAKDPRFPQVGVEELSDLEIELSVLTPLREIDDYRQIEIGRHGVQIEIGFRRAVFLPQVAPSQGWNVEQMLDHLARKAGLSSSAWRRPECRIYVFEAQVFHEEEDSEK